MHLVHYLHLLHHSERALADAYRRVGAGHQADADIYHACVTVAGQCDKHVEAVGAVLPRFGAADEQEPERLHVDGMATVRDGGLGLLRDLHDLYALASFVDMSWTTVGQAAKALRDGDLLATVNDAQSETGLQLKWLTTAMKDAAAQSLVAAAD